MDFPPHKDGITTLSAETAKRLGGRYKGFCVIGPMAKGDGEFDKAQKYKIYRSPLYDSGYLKIIPLLFLVPFVVIKHRIDNIIATNIGYGGFIAYILSKMRKLEYIVTAQGYEFLKFKDNRLIKGIYLNIYRNSKAIIACSKYVKDMLVEQGINGNKIIVAYPGVDITRYRPREVPEEFFNQHALKGKRIILTVSRLMRRKGHDYVIRALKYVMKEVPNVMYVVVGKGPARDFLGKLAIEAGMDKNIMFVGEVSDEDLVYYYNACELFIMPSREIEEDGHVEGLGIVYLEANACMKPVIGGRSGGVPEAIVDGKTGLLADPSDEADIAGKILKIMNNRQLAENMGRNGFERVKRDFNWDTYADKYIGALKTPRDP